MSDQKSSTLPAPLERRRRRARVEELLIDGKSATAITVRLAEEFGVSARTGFTDVALVQRRWRADDSRRGDVRRMRVIRRLERNADECREAKDLDGERQAVVAIGRLLGMGPASTTYVHAPVQVYAAGERARVRILVADPAAVAHLLAAQAAVEARVVVGNGSAGDAPREAVSNGSAA